MARAQPPDRLAESKVLGNLGLVCWLQGKHRKSLKYYETVLTLDQTRRPESELDEAVDWGGSDIENRNVLGVIAAQSAPRSIEAVALSAGVDREVAVAVICRAYVRGIVQIHELRTESLSYQTNIARKVS